jgi:predicted PurR-regulated permease PerM
MTVFQKSAAIGLVLAFCFLVYLLSPVLTPFLIAAFLAYLGDPLVNKLVKLHLSRSWAAIIVFSVILLLLISLIILLVPLLSDQVQMLIQKIPASIAWVQSTVLPWLQTHFDIKVSLNPASVKTALMAHWQQAGNIADKVFRTLGQSTKTFIEILINLVLIPVVTFYLLRDFPQLVACMKDFVPRKYISTTSELLGECNTVLGAFFRGQFLVMLALGIVYSAGLMLIGLDLALLIGVIIACLSIVPYLGTIIGLLLAITATLIQFHDVTHTIYVLILFLGGHLLEGMVLTPLLIGNRVGLHPVAVIFAILAGGALFGFFGVLLALPVAAVIMVLLKHAYQKYTDSNFYQK